MAANSEALIPRIFISRLRITPGCIPLTFEISGSIVQFFIKVKTLDLVNKFAYLLFINTRISAKPNLSLFRWL
jgi:hypothetical protein